MNRHLHGGDAYGVSHLPDSKRSTTVYFKFGNRIIGATGTASDHCHLNVLRLQVQKTLLDRLIHALLTLLPAAFSSWIEEKFPEWCLPERIVLKIQKVDWAEEFDQERAAYEKLRALQGITIPKLYGQIEYCGTRAFILSDIGGHCLATPEGAVLDAEDLSPLLHQALTALTSLGVSHDDIKLDNFHLVT